MPLAETQKQAGEWEGFSVKRREGVRYAVTGGRWHGEAGGELVRSRASHVIGLGNAFGFLWLVRRWAGGGTKSREAVSY